MSVQYFVYILTNRYNTVLYTGVTSDLKIRVFEHKERLIESFTKKYNVHKLVYFEIFQDAYDAISREKTIKGGSRKKKIDLITRMNPFWDDLYDKL
ncbi:MAG: GIY-YIG nuclease family protein [Candidatus Aminicenantes bacterium]|nr:GIY-YIG nuclease family protein [Candidatus Aminicenantes bacterium]